MGGRARRQVSTKNAKSFLLLIRKVPVNPQIWSQEALKSESIAVSIKVTVFWPSSFHKVQLIQSTSWPQAAAVFHSYLISRKIVQYIGEENWNRSQKVGPYFSAPDSALFESSQSNHEGQIQTRLSFS